MKLIMLGESLKTWINSDNTHTDNQQQQHTLQEHTKRKLSIVPVEVHYRDILRSESSFHGSQSSCLSYARRDSAEFR